MARSAINTPTNDLSGDGGAILYSIVQGEQVELPFVLSFLAAPVTEFVISAVAVEASAFGTAAIVGGVSNVLTTRVPSNRGAWLGSGTYTVNEYVAHNGIYYILIQGVGYTSTLAPDVDTLHWETFDPNTVYVQFPSTLGSNYSTEATIDVPLYAFFELSVSESPSVQFNQLWKPVRGVIQMRYSPTSVLNATA